MAGFPTNLLFSSVTDILYAGRTFYVGSINKLSRQFNCQGIAQADIPLVGSVCYLGHSFALSSLMSALRRIILTLAMSLPRNSGQPFPATCHEHCAAVGMCPCAHASRAPHAVKSHRALEHRTYHLPRLGNRWINCAVTGGSTSCGRTWGTVFPFPASVT